MHLAAISVILFGVLSSTSASAQSVPKEYGSALERLSMMLNMSQNATVSNVGRAFGLPLESRPTKWVGDKTAERNLIWKNSHSGAPIKAVVFAEGSEGSYLQVELGDSQCLTFSQIKSRFGASIEYAQKPVIDSFGTADTDQIQGLYVKINSKEFYIDGLRFRPLSTPSITGNVKNRCLSEFNIDGEQRVFLSEAPSL